MYKLNTSKWSVERAVYLVAGIFVLGSVVLGFVVHEYFLYFTGFVGAMLINFSLTGWCPMAILLEKMGIGNKK